MLSLVYLAYFSLAYSKTAYSEIESTADLTHYSINLNLNPAQSMLEVTTEIKLPGTLVDKGVVRFLLHGDLQVESSQAKIQKQTVTFPPFKQLADKSDVPLAQYEIKLPDQSSTLQLKYQGKIHHALDERHNSTPGLISADGVFLARSTA